ncbi:MAG: DNA-processing protein DprA [Deltaproteobacteria bacterium]|nr:DNA-processing protein DprA [Deltaproteobacteria bacterium]
MNPTREFLIALNTARDMSRGAICRLSGKPELWALEEPPRSKRAAMEEGQMLGVPPKQVARARKSLTRYRQIVDRESARAERVEATILTREDTEYPPQLLELELPPPVLYVRGRLCQGPALAMVGSRKASPYGLDAAAYFAHSLAEAGICIVSGFALGVDTAAHRGALKAPQGQTLAILGCGLEILYPKGQGKLREEVAARGALVSEFPMDRPPRPMNFPIRNRVIAALGRGTLVVQATPRSGSLITAHHALELGREVYAVPGPIFDDRARGPHNLIRDGACLATKPRDILETLRPTRQLPLDLIPIGQVSGRAHPQGKPGEVLQHLPPGGEKTADDLVIETGMAIDQILAALLELELAGWLRRMPGSTYRRILQ